MNFTAQAGFWAGLFFVSCLAFLALAGYVFFLLKKAALAEVELAAIKSAMPLNEKLKEFEALVRETYEREGRERFHLEKEVQSLALETQTLSQALRGDTKAQGDWGEVLLTQILESSGLREGHEFETQAVLSGDNGETLRPDAIVKLPGGKSLIVDAKVSLTAWDRYCRATDDEEKSQALKEHVGSIKRHIQGLGSRRYDRAQGMESPELVFLFTRIEPAWIEALRYEPGLLLEGEKHGVTVVSPTTLFATLKTVAGLWARDRQNKNAMLIADEAGKLYDKFVMFDDELQAAANELEKAASKLSQARRRLSEGPGNIVGRAEKIKELGAKTSRQLSTVSRESLEEENGGHSN